MMSEDITMKETSVGPIKNQALVIATCPHIVKKVFKELGMIDLTRCSKVCTLWESIAVAEKKRRKEIAFFLRYVPCKKHGVENERTRTRRSTIENHFIQEMCNLRIKPAFCFLFLTHSLFKGFEVLFPELWKRTDCPCCRTKEVAILSRTEHLNTIVKATAGTIMNTPATYIATRGVVGCDPDGDPVEVERGVGISAFLLPDFPGVTFRHVPLKSHRPSFADLGDAEAPVRCLLLFVTSTGSAYANRMVVDCLAATGEDPPRLAVGGAVVVAAGAHLGSMVVVRGRNVEAASCVIDRDDRREEVEAKLRYFGETGLLKNKCFAYMFACVGRGERLYRSEDRRNCQNVESSIFHRMYPGVPLAGVFGDGEIGHNYFPNVSKERMRRLERGEFVEGGSRFLYYYTTVFVLLSVKVDA